MKHYEYEISLFVEDELPENKKEELLAHLKNCKRCNALMNDFSNIKSDLANFYEMLPQNEFQFNDELSKSKKVNWSVKKPAFKISFSIAVASVAIFFFLINSNLNENKTNNHNLSSLDTTNAGTNENYLLTNFVQHTMINQLLATMKK